MGFSVSGSVALMAIAVFIAFGMFYTATSNGFEQVSEAQQATHDDQLERQNTAINITRATYNTTNSTLIVEITNDGSNELSIDATDLVADSFYQPQTEFNRSYVETSTGSRDPDTDLWLPGETLYIDVNGAELEQTPSDRVKIVTGPGVADSRAVKEVS